MPHVPFLSLLTLMLALLAGGAGPAFALKAHRLVAPVGQALHDEFGLLVAGAGDLNGDGRADFVVGSPGNSAAGQSAGRAYVFMGGAGLDSIPDLILTGAAAFDNFGRAASGAGDVNGDGFEDLIVGARNNDFLRRDAGRAYVFFGGTAMDSVADWFLNGTGETDQFGNAVDGAGDFNGDGWDDVIVGANRNDYGLPTFFDERGRAYVYHGGPGADGIPDWFVSGSAPGDQLGVSVAGAGDVNGDGFDDVIIGALRNDAGGVDAGRAYVFYGGVAPDTLPDLVLSGDSAGDEFGGSVDGGGDWNGDGRPDLLVGAALDDVAGAEAGRAYLYFGGPGADSVADVVMSGLAAGDQFGRWARFAGDVDGDDFGDVISGALYNDQLGADRGAAYVFLGGPGADGAADHVFEGEEVADELGCAVSGAGDVDGDGRDDVVIGAHYNETAGFHAGRAYVYRVIDVATETLLSLFQAEPIDAGIELRWMFGDVNLVSSVSVERATSAQGPWSAVKLDQSREGDLFVGLDRTVVTGQTYFYRLQAALRAGGSLTFGPLSGTAGLAFREFALSQLAPNPSPGRTRIEYTVPREAHVRLSVLDVQGREVALLVNGVSRPGSFQAAWNGMTDRGPAPAGLYFIQLTTPAGRMVKRLALNP